MTGPDAFTGLGGAAAGRTLVLSSRRVPADLRDHCRGNRAVLVDNAADVYGRVGRHAKVARDTAALSAAGFTVTEADLRTHRRDDTRALSELVAGADVVWVGGGNTYWLVHLLHRSGFATVLPDVLDAGVVYAGESAGAVACAPSLAGVDLVDDPATSPDPTLPGLGLVPFLAWAHWNPRLPGHETRHVPLPGVATPMWRLRDGEYLLVSGPRVEQRRTRPGSGRDRAVAAAGHPTLF